MTILNVDNVHAGYGEVPVLKGVDLSVEEGQIVCVIGPNGAGKSTLFKCIYNLLVPDEGNITFRGSETIGRSQRELLDLGIAYVLQRDAVFSDMTVRENLEMGAHTAGADFDMEKKISEMYELFPRLQERQSQKAGTLSGGERQMVEFARGLMQDPDLLLLDEPSAGLSPKNMDLVFERVVDINETNVTVLMIEQNIRTGLDYSDYGFVLEDGQTVHEGPADTLLEQDEIKKAYLGRA
jgi:ABC-type branched-subunit amino acid transport system ATPase component